MRTRTTLFVPAALVAALSIATLAGCSSSGSDSSSTPSASQTQASVSLPSDFPKSDVPLVDGQIVVARGDKVNGWSVTVQPTTKTGFADATAALEKAGYTKQAGSTDSKAIYTDDKYTVAVGTPGVSVTYTITAN
ncbi:hypothetical protein LLS1_35240 [Leifsonia sp. LS1]|uniref:hypothetical protein n=1 Tax=unclassified Leifsonia TaxID=2663824 RepID=UPI001CBD7590|nr:MULTISPECIES: hypothetical protein [unclassified Leifsonia]UAJ79644.1 hypothetical protein IT072_00605 [Leifsonia sp. ZF2019]GIT81855.1 hypothetical protein LLS1_35240 [Leifsonia sp. LS1]